MNAPLAQLDAVALLLRRFSVSPRHLVAPGPDAAALAVAGQAAARAPDHDQLRPWRLVWIPDARRAALGDLFAQDAAARGADPERARQRALAGPTLVGLLVHIDGGADVPAHEQWLTAGAALANFLNTLHLMGYAGKTLSGTAVQGAAVRAALERPGEQLVAWIALGTPARAAHPRARAEGSARPGWEPLSRWE